MRIDRLELVTSAERVEMLFHENVTLVTGLGRLEREALSVEILGALGPGRPGLNVDLIDSRRHHISIRRPLDGSPTAWDEDADRDVSDEFRCGHVATGPMNPLESIGLARHTHRSLLRLGPRQLEATASDQGRLERVAAMDQTELWETAITLAELEIRVRHAAGEDLALSRDELRAAEAVETAHAAVDTASDRLPGSRAGFLTAGLALVAAGAAATMLSIVLGAFLALTGLATIGFRLQREQELESAVTAERAALATVGCTSYLDHQLRTVDLLTGTPSGRTNAVHLVEARQRAELAWHEFVGPDISLGWVIDHQQEIAGLAHRTDATSQTPPPSATAALHQHIAAVRKTAGQPLPLILDDTFRDLDDFDLAAALAIVDDERHDVQVLIMTDDPRVVGWATNMAAARRATVIHLGGNDDPSDPYSPRPSPVPQHA